MKPPGSIFKNALSTITPTDPSSDRNWQKMASLRPCFQPTYQHFGNTVVWMYGIDDGQDMQNLVVIYDFVFE